jgi:hypothetical protein
MQLTPPGTPLLQVMGAAGEGSSASANDAPIDAASSPAVKMDSLKDIVLDFIVLPFLLISGR